MRIAFSICKKGIVNILSDILQIVLPYFSGLKVMSTITTAFLVLETNPVRRKVITM